MRCEDISAKSIDYLTGKVSDADELELEGHLKACLACRTEFAETLQIWTSLGDIPTFVPDSPVMRARFDAMMSAVYVRNPSRESVAHELRERLIEAPAPFARSEARSRIKTRSVRGIRFRIGQLRALAVIASVLVIAAALLVAKRFEWRADGLSLKRPREVASRLMPVSRPSKHPDAEANASLAGTDNAERWLEDRPDDSAVVQVSPHLAIANLENRVAAMDDLLNLERLQHAQPSRLYVLQRQREQLIDSLAQVRYAQMLVEETP